MNQALTLGISPCPNDTFMFHDLVHGHTDVPGAFLNCEMLDIEALNELVVAQEGFDLTKLSIPALAERVDDYAILSVGAALGRGCGPLVVRRQETKHMQGLRDLQGATVAIPGVNTTAYLVLRIFSQAVAPVPMRFDEVIPAVAAGKVDAGLIIHESRFTYRDHGLAEVADLGTIWEKSTGLPLPLGVIAAKRSLSDEVVADLESALRQSIQNAFAEPERVLPWVREHAQEIDDEVCRQHIELYVNDFSLDIGIEGRTAITELFERGRAIGTLPLGRLPWR